MSRHPQGGGPNRVVTEDSAPGEEQCRGQAHYDRWTGRGPDHTPQTVEPGRWLVARRMISTGLSAGYDAAMIPLPRWLWMLLAGLGALVLVLGATALIYALPVLSRVAGSQRSLEVSPRP
jgi:hypothetical protein